MLGAADFAAQSGAFELILVPCLLDNFRVRKVLEHGAVSQRSGRALRLFLILFCKFVAKSVYSPNFAFWAWIFSFLNDCCGFSGTVLQIALDEAQMRVHLIDLLVEPLDLSEEVPVPILKLDLAMLDLLSDRHLLLLFNADRRWWLELSHIRLNLLLLLHLPYQLDIELLPGLHRLELRHIKLQLLDLQLRQQWLVVHGHEALDLRHLILGFEAHHWQAVFDLLCVRLQPSYLLFDIWLKSDESGRPMDPTLGVLHRPWHLTCAGRASIAVVVDLVLEDVEGGQLICNKLLVLLRVSLGLVCQA